MTANPILLFGNAACRGAVAKLLLERVIEILVGVQVGTVGRQIKHFDSLSIFSKPPIDQLRLVGSEVVKDQKDLPLGAAHKTLQEYQE